MFRQLPKWAIADLSFFSNLRVYKPFLSLFLSVFLENETSCVGVGRRFSVKLFIEKKKVKLSKDICKTGSFTFFLLCSTCNGASKRCCSDEACLCSVNTGALSIKIFTALPVTRSAKTGSKKRLRFCRNP